MSRYFGAWAPYVPVAERRRRAERGMAKRRKAGHPVAPVTITGRAIATTFWGQAWCDNMESYHDYESRLPRGRSYVRNGSVVDLQIAPGRITAVVSGSELYDVTVTIKETPRTHWRSICADCAGGIDSLIELLQGRLSKAVMERLCRQQGGLFPRPSDIRFACTCPDHALMCKHVAAVLYGVGARLDHQPELLFRLRAVEAADLVAQVDAALPMSKQGPAAGRLLEADDVSALFGLDMAAETLAPEKPSARPKVVQARRTAAAPEGGTLPTKAISPGTTHRKGASSGKPPAKPAQAKATRAANKDVQKPVRPKRTASAKVLSGPVALEKTPAVTEIEAEREKGCDTSERSGARRRIDKNASPSPDVLEVPARGRVIPPGRKKKMAAVRRPA